MIPAVNVNRPLCQDTEQKFYRDGTNFVDMPNRHTIRLLKLTVIKQQSTAQRGNDNPMIHEGEQYCIFGYILLLPCEALLVS